MIINAAYNTLNLRFSRRLPAMVLLLACCLLAPDSPAQTPAAAPAPQDGASYAVLADLLENDQTREKLIEELRALAPETGKAQAPVASRQEAPATATVGADAPVSQRLAASLENFTSSVAHDFSDTAAVVKALLRGETGPGSSAHRWVPQLKVLIIALLTTLAAYFVLRMLAGLGFTRLNAWIRRDVPPPRRESATGETHGRRRFAPLALSRKLLGVSAALLIDVGATLLAALAGYIATVAVAANTPGASLFALQLLSAFVMIEVAKALSRGVFATRYEHLRLLPLSPQTAGYWNLWLTRVIGLTGYTLLVIVPVAAAILLPSIAKLLGLIIMLGVYIYGVGVVWKNRKAVRAGLLRRADTSSAAVFGTLIRVLARTWHLIALAYFTVLLVASQANQQEALAFMALATAQSAAAILIGMALAAALSSLLSQRILLPEKWRASLPLLEARINTYVPAALKSLRLLILVVVVLVVLDAWHAFNLAAWVQSDSGQATLAMLFHVGIMLAIAALSWTVIASIIEHRLGATGGHPSEREKTLLLLFRNAAAVVIATMTVLIVLSQIGINIGPLIAGAGVAGLAIGFGAQKLVQDVITGVFIQLENGMNRNDTVEVCGLFGTVEKITIRSVVIRTLDGGYHMIPFSSIDRLTNHTRDFGYHYGEYNIAHRESVDDAMAQLEAAFKDLMQDPALAGEVMEEISIPGVTALNERGFTIRVLIKTTPGSQWMIQRGFNRLVKQRFDAAGIEMPYPQTVVHFGRDKTGYAAPVDVRGMDALKEVAGATPAPGQTMRPALGRAGA